jgi:hypothetical protein
MQSSLGRSVDGIPPSLFAPRIVIGEIEEYDAALSMAKVKTVEYGTIECFVGTPYSDTDWPEAQSEQDNTQFGFRRPWRARERVVVLLIGSPRFAQGVVVCSLMQGEHKMHADTEKAETWTLHLRDDVWMRTLKTLMLFVVKQLSIESEEKGIDLTAKESIEATAEQDVSLHADENVTIGATKAVDVTAGTDASVSTGAANKLSLTGGTEAVVDATKVKLGAGALTEPVLKGALFVSAMMAMLTVLEVWGSSHIHICSAPGTPTTPPVPPLSGMLSPTFQTQAELSKSLKVVVE